MWSAVFGLDAADYIIKAGDSLKVDHWNGFEEGDTLYVLFSNPQFLTENLVSDPFWNEFYLPEQYSTTNLVKLLRFGSYAKAKIALSESSNL